MMTEPYDTSAEWRGNVTAKVDEFGRRLDGHDIDIREIRVNATAANLGLARLEASVEGLRGDIKGALAEQAQTRRNEFAELQRTVESSRLSSKERLVQIIVPLVIAAIIAVVTLLSTHVI
jgi:hypothetical protein